MTNKEPTEETPTKKTTWGEQTEEEAKTSKEEKAPSKTEAPLFKLLREIKEAVLSKEQQRAHHLDKIATATDRIATALEKIANLPTAKVSTVPPKTPATPVKPVETPIPTDSTQTTPTGIDKVKQLFPQDLLGLLKFEDIENYIKVAPRQYLGSENFAKIASIIRDNGGEYISAGKDSHFRVQK